ncbi:MAG: ATP-binding cassette domain-containing protein, partial [Alphaproteobacteria bacterium]|nr:ATP-binding cassette domain-containing protein [Alphaproteobacteria bacterium]
APILEAAKLGYRDPGGRLRLDEVSFTVHAGEIVGIAGIAGNGQSELFAAIAGIAALESGSLRLEGADITACTARERRRRGIAHIPEDRLRMAIVPAFSAALSLLLGEQRETWCRGRAGLLRPQAIRARAAALMAQYDVRPHDPALQTAAFSGGNQQKLVCAREMARQPKLLLVAEPTRGVDIGAMHFIHGRLLALRDGGAAILLVSSDLDEIRALADRILVMAAGAILAELPPSAGEGALGLAMAGIAGAARQAPSPSRP